MNLVAWDSCIAAMLWWIDKSKPNGWLKTHSLWNLTYLVTKLCLSSNFVFISWAKNSQLGSKPLVIYKILMWYKMMLWYNWWHWPQNNLNKCRGDSFSFFLYMVISNAAFYFNYHNYKIIDMLAISANLKICLNDVSILLWTVLSYKTKFWL